MHYSDLGVPGMVDDELLLTGAEVVVDCHVGATLRESIDNVAPNKAGAARNECPIYARRIHSSSKARSKMLRHKSFLRKVNNSGAMKFKMEWDLSQPVHCCEKTALSRWWAVEQQKSAAAGAGQLAPQRAGIKASLVVRVDSVVGDL